MSTNLVSKLLSVGCVLALGVVLSGCGGPDMEPTGPEMGELQRYMSEHPELMDTKDEEMDEIEGDEFADVD